jgi:hypothetical protein
MDPEVQILLYILIGNYIPTHKKRDVNNIAYEPRPLIPGSGSAR